MDEQHDDRADKIFGAALVLLHGMSSSGTPLAKQSIDYAASLASQLVEKIYGEAE